MSRNMGISMQENQASSSFKCSSCLVCGPTFSLKLSSLKGQGQVGNLREQVPWQQAAHIFLCWWKSQNKNRWCTTWTEAEMWSSPLSPTPVPLWDQAACLGQEVRSCSCLAKGKILLGQPDVECWGLQCLRQSLHWLLGAFEQMNVNSRSNISRKKNQHPQGMDWVVFFACSPYMSVRSCDFLRICRALHPFKEP